MLRCTSVIQIGMSNRNIRWQSPNCDTTLWNGSRTRSNFFSVWIVAVSHHDCHIPFQLWRRIVDFRVSFQWTRMHRILFCTNSLRDQELCRMSSNTHHERKEWQRKWWNYKECDCGYGRFLITIHRSFHSSLASADSCGASANWTRRWINKTSLWPYPELFLLILFLSRQQLRSVTTKWK
jgi:hypothetical protein